MKFSVEPELNMNYQKKEVVRQKSHFFYPNQFGSGLKVAYPIKEEYSDKEKKWEIVEKFSEPEPEENSDGKLDKFFQKIKYITRK